MQPQSQQQPGAERPPKLFAVVDDDQDVRNGLRTLLRAMGFEVATYQSAEEFLAERGEEFLCVVADIRMPGMTGIELQRELSTRPSSPPCILITAHSIPGDEQSALDLGAVALLRKPFSQERLLAAIEAAIAGRV